MEEARYIINEIPAVLYGEASDQVYLFIHGKCGSKEDARQFAKYCCCKRWQVFAVDLPGHGERKDSGNFFDPWHVVPELQSIMLYARRRWKKVALCANSIGAWFSMLAFAQEAPDGALFVSPVLNMPHLIERMMFWAGVTESELQTRREIETSFGETLSWRYYQYALEHPIETWTCPTAILYAGGDHLIQRQDVDRFVRQFHCDLTVIKDGEHWFHTPQQLEILGNWLNAHLEPPI